MQNPILYKTRAVLSILVASIAFTLGLLYWHVWLPANPNALLTRESLTPAEEEDIATAVFEYIIQNNVGLTQTHTVYFLRLFDADPSEKLLGHFEGRAYTVRKRSQAVLQKNRFIDRETNQYGVLLDVKSIKQLSSKKARVEGDWVIGWNDLGLHAYEVERKAEGWRVIKDEVIAEP